jgi:predicted aldo/keto reductase-like oxidoreductase
MGTDGIGEVSPNGRHASRVPVSFSAKKDIAMDACNGSRGGNRRQFLQTTAAAGAVLATTDTLLAADPKAATGVPTVTLGRTGQKVTKLGMGTSWALSPSFVQRAIAAGVRYIDTSESYENTVAEKVIGEVLDRTKSRKDVYLVTKNANYKTAKGAGAAKVFEEHLNASLERLKTDYVDCYYIHGIGGPQIGMLSDPGVKAAFDALKKAGKIKFCGLSCHDSQLVEVLDEVAKVGWIDQVMIKYNFRDVGGKDRHDDLQRVIDKCSKANIALVAMKTQGGAVNFPDKMKQLTEKGFKKEVAAIKTVWQDHRMQVVVSEMTTFSDLRENIAASRDELTAREARLLEEHRKLTANLYCHGCGHLCETAARGVPVSTVLRYLRYYEVYGKREQARQLYQALPQVSRLLVDANLHAAEDACPHGLPVVDLMNRASKRLA